MSYDGNFIRYQPFPIPVATEVTNRRIPVRPNVAHLGNGLTKRLRVVKDFTYKKVFAFAEKYGADPMAVLAWVALFGGLAGGGVAGFYIGKKVAQAGSVVKLFKSGTSILNQFKK